MNIILIIAHLQEKTQFSSSSVYSTNIVDEKMHSSADGPPPKHVETSFYGYCEKVLKWINSTGFAYVKALVLDPTPLHKDSINTPLFSRAQKGDFVIDVVE